MKKKLHRIGNSKELNIRQMTKMAENLATVYKQPSLISVEIFDYYNFGEAPIASYRIYISNIYNEYPKTWQATIKSYRKLMKGKKDGS